MCDLTKLQREMDDFCARRKAINYTGVEDLQLLEKIRFVRSQVTRELDRVRAQIEVCPREMIADLKNRELELLEWKHSNT